MGQTLGPGASCVTQKFQGGVLTIARGKAQHILNSICTDLNPRFGYYGCARKEDLWAFSEVTHGALATIPSVTERSTPSYVALYYTRVYSTSSLSW